MDVNNLDSPGASSGYCSSTEEEMAFSFKSPLPPGYTEPLPPSSSSSSSSSSSIDSIGFEELCPGGVDFLLDAYVTSNDLQPHQPEVEFKRNRGILDAAELEFDDRNFREFWDSWMFGMTIDNLIPGDWINQDVGFDPEEMEPCSELLTDLMEKEDCLLTDSIQLQLDYTRNRADPTDHGTPSPRSGDDWNVLMSLEECEPGCRADAMISGSDDLSLDLDLWKESFPEQTEVPPHPTSNTPSPDETIKKNGQDTHDHSSGTVTNRSGKHENSTHVERCKNTDNSFPRRSISRSESAKQKLTSAESTNRVEIQPPPRTHPTGGSGRTRSTPSQVKPTYFHGLEDHRYSSRKGEVRGISTRVTTTHGTQFMKSRLSVLETLLRTNNRFNPNIGSNAIFCRETKKRAQEVTPNCTQSGKQSRGGGHMVGHVVTISKRHQNTLLHNLLTCRMDQVEKRGGKVTGGRDYGITKEVWEKRKEMIEDLIPSENPDVHCSFLFEETEPEVGGQEVNLDRKLMWMDASTLTEEATPDGDTNISSWSTPSSINIS